MAKVRYKKSEETFINPYNFVSVKFDKLPQKSEESEDDKNLTGVIKCTLTTLTPLAIPNVAESVNKNGDHQIYDCMRNLKGVAMIPGSSIRGVIRSVYETVTESCFSTINKKDVITIRRETNTPLSAGVIKRVGDEWILYECKRYMLKKSKNEKVPHGNNVLVWDESECPTYEVKTKGKKRYIKLDGEPLYSGDFVSFDRLVDDNNQEVYYKKRMGKKVFDCAPVAQKIYRQSKRGECSGILVIGEDISGKHHESVFCVGNEKRKVTADELEKLENVISIYRDTGINKNHIDNFKKNDEKKTPHYGYETFERMKKKGVIPIWFSKNNSYLSPASIGRVALEKSVYTLIDKKAPCENVNKLCKACDLFGMIGNTSKSSRVRFTDAYCESSDPFKGYYTLEELGGPKITYMPFYSNKEKGSYDDYGAEIRGRKFYWHSNDYETHMKKYEGKVTDFQTQRNSTIELIDKNKKFSFDVYFDKISKTQLYELVWALNFWENTSDSKLCHKLGRGKPLGLGSVKINVNSIEERCFDGNGYSVNKYAISYNSKNVCDCYENNLSVDELLKIAKFDEKRRVCYPYIIADEKDKKKNNAANHRWFTENKNGVLSSRDWSVQQLPEIKEVYDEEKSLYAFELLPNEPTGSGYVNGEAKFTQGKQYTAQISGRSNNGKFYYLTLTDDNGKRVSRYCSAFRGNTNCKDDTSITVLFDRTGEYNGNVTYQFRLE